MLSLKGVWFGLGVSFLGTVVYLVLLVRWIIHRSVVPSGGSVGIDLVSLLRHEVLRNPLYWLLILGLFAAAYAIVSLWQRPAI